MNDLIFGLFCIRLSASAISKVPPVSLLNKNRVFNSSIKLLLILTKALCSKKNNYFVSIL